MKFKHDRCECRQRKVSHAFIEIVAKKGIEPEKGQDRGQVVSEPDHK